MVVVPSPIKHSCMEHGRLIEAAATTNSAGAAPAGRSARQQPLCIYTAHIALYRSVTIDTPFRPFTRSASNERML
jgi:hypothetical protein